MGLFDKLFGKKEELPPLDAASPAAAGLEKHRGELAPFVAKMHDRLEFLPAEAAVYCYLGKPPAMFGMVWFSEGKEHNLKSMATAKGLSTKKLQLLSVKLGEVYQKYAAEPRFSAMVGGKGVIVTPSEAFLREVIETLHAVE